tara:strand:- start:536 stop:934 length:399 start_codon:yes stop_codon:yes gene_type:complete
MQPSNKLLWTLKIVASFIMFQSLFFKFSGAAESIELFTTLGLEPWGRYGTGIMEIIAIILIMIPSTTAFGALLGVGIMSGAIISHLTKLGIVIQNDNGQLFIYALVVMACCILLLFYKKDQIVNLVLKGKRI